MAYSVYVALIFAILLRQCDSFFNKYSKIHNKLRESAKTFDYLESTNMAPVLMQKLKTPTIIKHMFDHRYLGDLSRNGFLGSLHSMGKKILSSSKVPEIRSETWKYNNLPRIFKVMYKQLKDRNNFAASEVEKIKAYMSPACTDVLVFIDGEYDESVSRRECVNLQYDFLSLKYNSSLDLSQFVDNLTYTPECYEQERHSYGSDSLTGLNLAKLKDVGILRVPRNRSVVNPVQVLFVSTDTAASATYPKLLVVLEEGSSLKLKQSYVSIPRPAYLGYGSENENTFFVNSNTRVILGNGSSLEHTYSQELSESARQFEVLSALLGHRCSYEFSGLLLGSELSRINLHVDINDTFANATIKGATIAGAGQSLDLHSSICHNAQSSNSEQQHRNVVGGNAEAIFKGRIRIPREGQLTSSSQLCRSLMMGEKARIVAMPTLEIKANNVVCSHGATISDLDENSIFYLNARGLTRQEAKKLMIKGFVAEMFTRALMDENDRDRINAKLDRICESAPIGFEGVQFLSM